MENEKIEGKSEKKIDSIIAEIEEALQGYQYLTPRLNRAITRIAGDPEEAKPGQEGDGGEVLVKSIFKRLEIIKIKLRNENCDLAGLLDKLDILV